MRRHLRLGLKLSFLRYSLAGSDDPISSLSCSVIDVDAGDFQKCSVSSSLILAHSLCAYTPFCMLSLDITITKKQYHDKACNTHASPDNVNVVGFYFNHLYLFLFSNSETDSSDFRAIVNLLWDVSG